MKLSKDFVLSRSALHSQFVAEQEITELDFNETSSDDTQKRSSHPPPSVGVQYWDRHEQQDHCYHEKSHCVALWADFLRPKVVERAAEQQRAQKEKESRDLDKLVTV